MLATPGFSGSFVAPSSVIGAALEDVVMCNKCVANGWLTTSNARLLQVRGGGGARGGPGKTRPVLEIRSGAAGVALAALCCAASW
jgi:hypothetical protein